MTARAPGSRSRRAAVGVLVAAAIVGAALLVCPVRTTIIRAGIVGTAVAAVAAGRVILSQRGRRVLDVAAGAAVVWTVATAEPAPLSPQRFVEALRSYEGTTYVWGGETARGIDCSGLIRAALVETQLRAGRPGAALRLWWRDVAARDLGAAHPWLFRGPERLDSVAASGTGRPPGTIAVTFNGLHVLAHLGGGRWIQASPNDHRVTIRDAAEPDPWFVVPVDLWTFRAE